MGLVFVRFNNSIDAPKVIFGWRHLLESFRKVIGHPGVILTQFPYLIGVSMLNSALSHLGGMTTSVSSVSFAKPFSPASTCLIKYQLRYLASGTMKPYKTNLVFRRLSLNYTFGFFVVVIKLASSVIICCIIMA